MAVAATWDHNGALRLTATKAAQQVGAETIGEELEENETRLVRRGQKRLRNRVSCHQEPVVRVA